MTEEHYPMRDHSVASDNTPCGEVHTVQLAGLTQDQQAYISSMMRSVAEVDSSVRVGGPRKLPA